MNDAQELSQQRQTLMDLIFEGRLREMMQLVPNLSTLDFTTANEGTPLTLAVGTAEEEVIEYLLLRKANPNFEDNNTLPLLVAIERSVETDKNTEEGDEYPLAIVELLLRYGADFTKKDPTGESAYDFACKVHHPAQELFERLIQEGKNNIIN